MSIKPVEYRSVIKFLVKKGLSIQQVTLELKNVYGDECPSTSTIDRLHREFRFGRTNVENEPRSGRPIEIDYSKFMTPVRKVIEDQRNISIEELSTRFKLSYGTMRSIIVDNLGLKKLSTTWVPHVLNDAHKRPLP